MRRKTVTALLDVGRPRGPMLEENSRRNIAGFEGGNCKSFSYIVIFLEACLWAEGWRIK